MTFFDNIEINNLLKQGIIFPLVIFLLFLVILEIWLVNRLSTYGEKISQLEKTSAVLILENQILKNKIDQKSSLVELEKLANKLGFKNIQGNIVYIRSDENTLSYQNQDYKF